jgi:hypothetical protein
MVLENAQSAKPFPLKVCSLPEESFKLSQAFHLIVASDSLAQVVVETKLYLDDQLSLM